MESKMTVSSTNYKNTYSGNSSTTVFAYTFRILDDDDILVQLKNTSTGVLTTKTKTTDYTVSGVDSASGGNITFVTAPTTGNTVVLTRTMTFTQETDYNEYDTFPASSHETALDKLTMENLQLKENVDRTIRFDAAVSGVSTTIVGTPAAYNTVQVNAGATALEFVTAVDLGAGGYTFPAGAGMLAQTATANAAARTITGTTNKITVTNGDGVSGDPTITIPSGVVLVAPVLGTPASGTLTNCTGTASGLTAGAATTAAAVTNGGALNTPASGTLTNCTGLPEAGITGSAWTTFVPTCTGYSGTPTTDAAYRRIGKTCFIRIYVTGTSNTTGFTITNLPFTSGSGASPISVCFGRDNGSDTAVMAQVQSSTTTVVLFKGFSATGGTWTNSGTKDLFCQLVYETV